MQKIFGYIQGQRVELSVHEKNERGLRNEAAIRFAAAMLSNPNCPLSNERLVEVAVDMADNLAKKLEKN